MADNHAFLVSREEWETKVINDCRADLYPDVYEAIEMLKTREVGARVRFPAGDRPKNKRQVFRSYANRFGIHVRTRHIGDWIFAVTTPMGRNQKKKGDCFSVTKPEGPLTSRGRSFQSEGSCQ